MKRKHLKSLKLNKKSISNLRDAVIGGYHGQTCEGPCQGGTTCCSANGAACEEEEDKDPIRIPATSFRTILNCSLLC